MDNNITSIILHLTNFPLLMGSCARTTSSQVTTHEYHTPLPHTYSLSHSHTYPTQTPHICTLHRFSRTWRILSLYYQSSISPLNNWMCHLERFLGQFGGDYKTHRTVTSIAITKQAITTPKTATIMFLVLLCLWGAWREPGCEVVVQKDCVESGNFRGKFYNEIVLSLKSK